MINIRNINFDKITCKSFKNIITLFLIFPSLSFAESMPDYYSESGFNANRNYETQQTVEKIDPFSGGLQLHNIDMVVPGNGGIDIVVRRNYRAISKPTAIGNINYLGERTVLGIGWDIHFGRIWSGDTTESFDSSCGLRYVSSINNPVLELSDGTQKRLIDENNTTGLNRYVTKDRWIGKCLPGGGLEIYSPDGLKYTFDYFQKYAGKIAWNVTRIEDKSNNRIDITYHNGTQHALIDTVSSPDGRSVKFNYDIPVSNYSVLLKSVTNSRSNQSIRYTHHRHANYSFHFFLERATKSDNSYSSYLYDERSSGGGAISPGHFNIKKMTNTFGASTSYTFDEVSFSGGIFIATQVLKTKSISGAGVKSGTWNYSYTPGLSSGKDVTQIRSPNYCTKFIHKGVRQVTSGNVWTIGTLFEKNQYKSTSCSGTPTQSEIYTWDKSLVSSQNEYHRRENVVDINTYQPILKTKVIIRDGSSFTTTYSNFDQYGNPRSKSEVGPSTSRNTTYTYNNLINSTSWFIGLVDTTTITGISGNINNDYYSVSSSTKAGKLQQTNRYGAITKYDYDTGGNLRTVTDPENKTIIYTNYSRGIPQTESHPETVSISRIVNASTGTVRSEKNGRGKTTSYTYDSLNRVKSITTPKTNDSNITVSWASGGRVRTVTRGGLTSVTTNDGFGNPISVKTGTITKTYRYNSEGQLLFESYPSSTKGTTYTRDVLGRITKITHPDGTSQIHNYLSNNRVSIRNERLNTSTKTYQSYGDPDEKYLIKNEEPEGITTVYSRNKLGQIETITQGGQTRTYTYDSKYYLKTITHPETGLTTYGRDNVGNMTSKKIGSSGITTYRYDDLHRLEFINYPNEAGTTNVTYVYNKNNNLDRVTRNGVVRSIIYDDNDNVTSHTLSIDGKNFPVGYVYDNLDNLDKITYPSGRSVLYSPNVLGRATEAEPYVSNVTYHDNGTPNRTTYKNGITVTKTLTPNREWVDTISATGVIDLDYDYDDIGNISSITNYIDRSKDISMFYDSVDRLTTANGAWGNGSIGYDALGNIKSKNIGAFRLAYNYNTATNKLSSTSGIANNTYQYDLYGNIKSDGTKTYSFDDASNMVSATGGVNLANTYDGNNILVKSIKDGLATYHLYDQAYNLMGEYNASGNMRKEYVRLNGKNVAIITEVPAKPGLVSITTPDIGGNYSLSWGATSGELTHYELITTDGTSCTTTGATNTSSVTNFNVTNQSNGTYYYCVRACNAEICGDYQSSGSRCAVVGASSAPCIPPSLSIPNYSNTGNYSASWGAATGTVTHYELYEANNALYTGELLTYSGTALTTAITGKTNGIYYYRIKACNNTACSLYVNAATRVVIPPSVPSSITAPTSSSSGNFTVSWGSSTGNVTKYELYESSTSSFSSQALIYQGLNLSRAMSSKPEANYYYRVRACNSNECSSYKTLSHAVVVKKSPSTPVSITVPSANSTGHYSLSWGGATTGVITHYELYESSSSNFAYQSLLYSGAGLTKNIDNKIDGTFYYRVRACNGPSCSSYRAGTNPTVVKNSPYTAALITIINYLLLN